MVWTNPDLEPLINRSKDLIKKFFNKTVTALIFVCTLQELSEEVIKEMNQDHRPLWEENYIRLIIPSLEGKYFHDKNEIWLIQSNGEKINVILHEMIHSFQQCRPNRENIIDFISFKLLNDSSFIKADVLHEWKEIEKDVGFKAILNNIQSNSDCEEFNS